MNIAVVGGIASGKSEVLKTLKSLGAFVVSVDDINKSLLIDKGYIEKIKLYFPESVIDGKIDKVTLKNTVFSNEINRKMLNEISHGLILSIIKGLIDSSKINFIEIPLFVEAKIMDFIDEVWAVKSSKETRLSRLIKRDNINMQLAEKILEIQCLEELVYDIADEIIINDSDLESLRNKVILLYKKKISCLD